VRHFAVPQPTERQRISNQIDAAMMFAGEDFVSVRRTLRLAGACEFKYLVAWSGEIKMRLQKG
jgi:hypothetical protein